MKARLVAGVVALVIVLVFSSIVVLPFLDLSSYAATGGQTLNPPGPASGRAIVVYDPGLSGTAQKAAQMIAEDLQQKGYAVDLAGVRNGLASNVSRYSIVVAGGPMYFGQASSSIDEFLKRLVLPQDAQLGIFVTTGNSQIVGSDYQMLKQQVASATNHPASIAMVMTGNETQDCSDFVSSLLK